MPAAGVRHVCTAVLRTWHSRWAECLPGPGVWLDHLAGWPRAHCLVASMMYWAVCGQSVTGCNALGRPLAARGSGRHLLYLWQKPVGIRWAHACGCCAPCLGLGLFDSVCHPVCLAGPCVGDAHVWGLLVHPVTQLLVTNDVWGLLMCGRYPSVLKEALPQLEIATCCPSGSSRLDTLDMSQQRPPACMCWCVQCVTVGQKPWLCTLVDCLGTSGVLSTFRRCWQGCARA